MLFCLLRFIILNTVKTNKWERPRCVSYFQSLKRDNDLGLRVKCPSFLSDFYQNSILFTDFNKTFQYKLPWTSIQRRPSCYMRTDRRTDRRWERQKDGRHDEANRFFSHFFATALRYIKLSFITYKWIKGNQVSFNIVAFWVITCNLLGRFKRFGITYPEDGDSMFFRKSGTNLHRPALESYIDLNITVFWMIPYKLVDRYQSCGRTCCLHLQGRRYGCSRFLQNVSAYLLNYTAHHHRRR
jgi:hypothetical protein